MTRASRLPWQMWLPSVIVCGVFILLLRPFWAAWKQRPVVSHLSPTGALDERGYGFPAWSLDEELLEEFVVVDGRGADGAQDAAFLNDGDGHGVFLASYPGAWRALDEGGRPALDSHEVQGVGGDLQRFVDSDGMAYTLELRGDESWLRHEEVICRRGNEIQWRRKANKLEWHGCDPLRLEDGSVLVLCHGFEDFVAIRPGGEVAWDRSDEFHPSYGHRAHPALPGVYLCHFGDISWHRVSDGRQIGAVLKIDSLYITGAAAFVGPAGERLAFVVGMGEGDTGGIAVIDADGELRWSAVTPGGSLEVIRVDREDGTALFAVTTNEGDLFLIDAEGTVLHQRSLPQKPDPKIGVAVYELNSGPLGKEHVGIAVCLLDWIAVYRLKR